jgi:hypothetical protein
MDFFVGSEIEKKIRIRDKHAISATLLGSHEIGIENHEQELLVVDLDDAILVLVLCSEHLRHTLQYADLKYRQDIGQKRDRCE